MRNGYAVTDKFKEFRKHLFYEGRIHDHLIGDAGEFDDTVRYGLLRIYKCRKPVNDLSVLHFDGAYLGYVVLDRRKARGLYIEYHIGFIYVPAYRVCYDASQIVHDVCFHTVDDFEEIIVIRIFLPRFFSFCLFFFPQIVP